ncbi:MAG: tetratricopeptide repeat protein [Verrucomicrobia bacterium]|nr:tetratricopeptide repeat protein [Verrucomicrobiota bacterium]
MRGVAVVLTVLSALWTSGQASETPVTFNGDIAPLLYQHCVPCHRPEGDAPFPLVTFDEVRRKADTLLEVISDRTMPPWPPGPGNVRFQDDRHLAETEIAAFRHWKESGFPEGPPDAPPPPPEFEGVWQLGEPDLVVTPQVPILLPAEGPDRYRNLVIPVPRGTNRYVRAIQIRPGSRAVHHAFVLQDRHGHCRRLDAADPEPGFPGLDLPDGMESPGGHFLGWQPGRRAYESPPGLAWVLPAGADLVIQLHLQPTGRAETICPQIGLYFTNRPPEREFFKLDLSSLTMDIPPGDSRYVVEDSFVLPTDVSLIGLNPHCHYLGRDLQGLAVLPDGTTNVLLHIPRWNFNWQGDYRLETPLSLPKGTRLQMRYVFDNSTNNPFNPNHPPRRVRYGVETQDEMAELWFQMLPANAAGLASLRHAYGAKAIPEIVAYQEYRLRRNSKDAHAHGRLGVAKAQLGDIPAAMEHLRTAIQLDPNDYFTRFNLGALLREKNERAAAEREFAAAVRLNPTDGRSQGALGISLGERGRLAEAEAHLREALRLDPQDEVARSTLAEVVRFRAVARQRKAAGSSAP